jgi:polyhydroxybutyrate depolymerase
MTRHRSAVLLASSLVLAACGDDTSSGTDAGPAGDRDGGVSDRDSGGPRDAGETPDGGSGGTDAGTTGSVGCVSGEGLESGERTFMLDGNDRRYLLYMPNGYTRERAWPLVFALHGNGGSVDYWNGTGGDRNIRGEVEDEAVLVIAEAIDGNWRDYAMPSSSWPARIELELNYFDTIVEELTTDLCIDEDEIFTMGFSGGGSFSGVLGCRREYIRAIGSGGSVIYFEEEECVSTPASWTTMGAMELADRGTTFRDFFRDAAGCDETSMPADPDPCIAFDGCEPETPVTYCQHPGGHVWPSFGTPAAWQFFRQFVD